MGFEHVEKNDGPGSRSMPEYGTDSDEIEHLVPGTLIALSTDLFKTTCWTAVVAENEGLRLAVPFVDVF